MLEHALDIKSGYPWWAVSKGLLHGFPPLLQNARCDVMVVGRGMAPYVVPD